MEKTKKYTSLRIRTETNNQIEYNIKDRQHKKPISKIDYIQELLLTEQKYNTLLNDYNDLIEKYHKIKEC